MYDKEKSSDSDLAMQQSMALELKETATSKVARHRHRHYNLIDNAALLTPVIAFVSLETLHSNPTLAISITYSTLQDPLNYFQLSMSGFWGLLAAKSPH